MTPMIGEELAYPAGQRRAIAVHCSTGAFHGEVDRASAARFVLIDLRDARGASPVVELRMMPLEHLELGVTRDASCAEVVKQHHQRSTKAPDVRFWRQCDHPVAGNGDRPRP